MTHGIFPGCAYLGKGKQRGSPTARLLLVLLVGLVLPATAGADIGNNSCLPTESEACEGNTAAIKNNSCVGSEACEGNEGDIGNNSCVGSEACEGNTAAIGNNSCIGDEACDGTEEGDIGNNSCNASGVTASLRRRPTGPHAKLDHKGVIARERWLGWGHASLPDADVRLPGVVPYRACAWRRV